LPEGDLRVFEDSAHSAVTAPATGANVQCDACHESHSSRNESLLKYSGYMVCMQCHTSAVPDPNAPDVLSRLQLNPDANAMHPILPADQVGGAKMTCQNCHNTHASTVATPLVDPHNPSPAGAWVSDEKAFCFRCHDGLALPTSTETTPWAGAVLGSGSATTLTNIDAAYAVNVHGLGTRSDPTTTTAHLRVDMAYTADMVLECSSCHDPHGSMNNFALRQNVSSAGATMTVGGLLVAEAPGGGYDVRFFCSSCHILNPAAHMNLATPVDFSLFPMDCTQCHRHETGGVGSTEL
jgi:predicted CXXCH cytochrome family protein